jgi:GNAT superfamily N-acetyltransferase
MVVEIAPLTESELAAYATVPISFVATDRLALDVRGTDSADVLTRMPLPRPFEKNYDMLPGISPTAWHTRFMLNAWGLFVAREEEVIVGGAAIAPAVDVGMDAAGRGEAAVLWDLRVAPGRRGHRIGTALFQAAEQWAVRRGYSVMLAETQDINVAACRFYQAMGCRLISFDSNAYPDHSGEAQLVWRRALVGERLAGFRHTFDTG